MYLVTGGAGFIGSHIVRGLVASGMAVRVLDNFCTGKRENLLGVEDKVEIVTGDILDKEVLREAMKGVEVVFHEAALRSVPFSVENPTVVNRVNVEGTINVLEVAKEGGVRRVVYASSSSVYGTGGIPNREEAIPRPISPYAVSKLAGEYYCKVFGQLYGLETVGLRYFNVYGPRQDPNSQYAAVIPRFIYHASKKDSLQIHGDGLQSRDFTYIDNVVDANLLAARTQDGIGGVFNVSQGKAFTILKLIGVLQAHFDNKLHWFHTDSRTGDIRHTLGDISLAERHLGYRPKVAFEEGILRTVRYFEKEIATDAD